MKAIMVMFDSLNRRMLSPYGCDWVHTPNFERLSRRTVTFDNCYVGSMPCMPARRELHTGRYNFLHRGWGPLEPFDDSMPEILKQHGIYTHLATDHYHYFEEGGCDYHTRYNSWEFERGQEGDPWIADLRPRQDPQYLIDPYSNPMRVQDIVNRSWMRDEKDQPQPKTFAAGERFLRTNHDQDNWFLTIETFDPHEPYFTSQRYKDLYPHGYSGPVFDWPPYAKVTQTDEQVQHMRYESAALHSMCDLYLGRVLDLMDELNLWDDTLLIVNTDHGFLLGEHDWWAKVVQPFYDEVAHMPLFIWDPRSGKRDERRQSLVQTIDLAPTLLEYFGVPAPVDMQGRSLAETVSNDRPVRDAALFGVFGGHVNITDGRYVYMRAPQRDDNRPLYEYTLMPTHMRHAFNVSELQDIQIAEPFAFSKGCRTMKIAGRPALDAHSFGTMLFDLRNDPSQLHSIQNTDVEARLAAQMVQLMKASDAPPEQYERLGLAMPVPSAIS